jgi:hypothetical protein
MKKFCLILAWFLLSIPYISTAQNPLDDENNIDLETWKHAPWKSIGDFWISPITNKAKITEGKNCLFAEGKAILESPIVNTSFLLSFEVNGSAGLHAEFKLNAENSLLLAIDDLGKIKSLDQVFAAEKYASRTLGLWQKIEISMEDAPKQSGYSLINYLKINDVLVQQHLLIKKSANYLTNHLKFELFEGKLAIRNLKIIEQSDIKPIKLSNIEVEVWDKFNWEKISTTGEKSALKLTIPGLNQDVGQDMVKKNHILKYDANLNVDKDGIYNITIDFSGKYKLIVDDKLVTNFTDEFFNRKRFNHKLNLTAGTHKMHLEYLKVWYPPALGVFVSGAGAKPYALHEVTSLPESKQGGKIIHNPVLKTEIIRGFYMHNGLKNTTAMAVGFSNKYNYAIDLEKGTILSIWKGDFVDLTEMWFERGEPQTFAAEGMLYNFTSKDILASNSNTPVPIEYKGYTVDNNNSPTFEYQNQDGSTCTKAVQVSDGKLLVETKFSDFKNKKLIIASGENLEKIEKDLYRIGQLYVMLDDRLKPEIIIVGKEKHLMLPAQSSVSYQLAW